jgi:thiamine biosynthesis protein ThiS
LPCRNYTVAVTITVNGETRPLSSGMTVTALLAELGLDQRPCAVEVNRKLVSKPQHESRVLADGDAVEVVTLVGGG